MDTPAEFQIWAAKMKSYCDSVEGELREALKEAAHQTDMGCQAAVVCSVRERERDAALATVELARQVVKEYDAPTDDASFSGFVVAFNNLKAALHPSPPRKEGERG